MEPNWRWDVNTKVTMMKKCMQEAQVELRCLRDDSDAEKGVSCEEVWTRSI